MTAQGDGAGRYVLPALAGATDLARDHAVAFPTPLLYP